MKIFPQISQPTLDSFRKDVYRPRLALLLLILLLSSQKRAGTDRLTESSDDAHLHGAGDHMAIITAQVKTTVSPLFLDRLRAPFGYVLSTTAGTEQGKKAKGPTIASKDQPAPKGLKVKESGRGKAARKSASASILRIPRLVLQMILQGEALAAIIPLHILWIIRLAGMMMEDSMVKSSAASQRLPTSPALTTPAAVVVELSILGFLALGSLFLTSSSSLSSAMSLLSIGHYGSDTLDSFSGPSTGSLAHSLRLIVVLELTATLLSLLSPLMKINSPKLTHLLPRTLQLPSPSHAPAIADLLPLPPGLAEVLSGRSSGMQSRAGRRGIAGLRREPAAGGIRHGAFAAPLTLPEQPSGTSDRIPKKAPRVKGLKVQVDSGWLLENVIVLWGYLIGSMEYLIIVLSLPTLSPTSFPSILALLSLRSQLSALVIAWTSARRSIECLEFVRRRWASSRTKPRWTPDQDADILCPVCLEHIQRQSKDNSASVNVESCCLDCGHELHAVCLVQIFLGAKQAYCPICHDALKASPPLPNNDPVPALLDAVQ